jgi:hypothetical protein
MTDEQTSIRIWALDRSGLDKTVHLINCSQKIIISAFFGTDAINLLDVLPTGAKITVEYFCDNIVEAIARTRPRS